MLFRSSTATSRRSNRKLRATRSQLRRAFRSTDEALPRKDVAAKRPSNSFSLEAGGLGETNTGVGEIAAGVEGGVFTTGGASMAAVVGVGDVFGGRAADTGGVGIGFV